MKKIIFKLALFLLTFLFLTRGLGISKISAQNVGTQATIEPILTFTITGLKNGTNITTRNPNCLGADITNPGSGNDATSTYVNLGTFKNGVINISAQELTVSTNISSGYSLTATSSGKFINTTAGAFIADANGGNGLTANDTPSPALFPASGNEAFGIHSCGEDINSNLWGNVATGFNSGAKYINPWNNGSNNYYSSIASYNAAASARKTIVEYAGTISPNTPAGTYNTQFTFVITVNF